MKKLLCSLLLVALSMSLCAAKKPKALLIMLDGMRNDAYITQGFSPMIDGNRILGDDYKTAATSTIGTIAVEGISMWTAMRCRLIGHKTIS